MPDASLALLKGTSKPIVKPAIVVLEDGRAFKGSSIAAQGEVFGEVCFNTGLEGYLEVITDPSYAGQIVVMTYPQIGNYGVSDEDFQSAGPALSGLIVRDMCTKPSNWRSVMSLPEYLKMHNIVAVEGIDTRALVRHVRDNGAMRAGISTCDTDVDTLLAKVRASDSLVGINHVEEVSRTSCGKVSLHNIHRFALVDPKPSVHKVVAYDCGAKYSILDNLVRSGCEVTAVPWDTPAHEVLSLSPDGVFLSNGPGDPDAVTKTYTEVEKLIGKIPIFGICLGHQMLCKAAGAQIEKLKFGHHGNNQPVMNILSNCVEITVQNHGFGLVWSSLGPLIKEESGDYTDHVKDLRTWVERSVAPVVYNSRFGRIALTHVNLNDGTPEGIAFLDVPAFCVQYHPEATPGPTDSHYLFNAFINLMDGLDDYLSINIAKDRLAEWKFADIASVSSHEGVR